MKGRPPKPAETKLLEGTWRADRHGDPATLIEAEGVPLLPDCLAGDAKGLWETVVPGLVSSRVARARDAAQLMAMCEWWGRYRRYSAVLDKAKPGSKGVMKLLHLAEASWRSFDRIASKFGLTPADRMRLRAEGPAEKAGIMSRKR